MVVVEAEAEEEVEAEAEASKAEETTNDVPSMMVCIYGKTVHSTSKVLVGTVVEVAVAVVVAVVMVEDTNSNHTTHSSTIIHICHLRRFKGVSVYHLRRCHP